jgi:tetratricopeptide (TPR) repeat protein
MLVRAEIIFPFLKFLFSEIQSDHFANPLSYFIMLVNDNEKFAWSVLATRIPSPWDKSETLSRSLLRQLISKNHLPSKYTYATMIVTGSMRGDVPEAIQLWEECSRAGHSWAKSNLAKIHVDGKFVRQDLDRAARLYQEAWECQPVMSETHAHTSALNLADLYLKAGRPKEASAWLIKAADEAHDILAQYQLGHAYSYGKFELEVDVEKAINYTQKAADGGLVLAQHNLGCLFYEGSADNPPDYVAASHYFSKAHYQEYYWSTLNLAAMFSAGKGVPQNFATAHILVLDVIEFGSEEQKKAAMEVLNNLKNIEDGKELQELPIQNRVQEAPNIMTTTPL